MFDTAAEANQKLSGSLVLYNEDPVWCRDARDQSQGRVQISVVRARDSVELGWVSINDLDVKNLGERVGYFNMDYQKYKVCSYGRRLPIRHVQSCQGLSNSNVRIDNMPWSVVRTVRFTDAMTMGGYEAISNKYPGLVAVKYQFGKNSDTNLGFAFDKNFAFEKGKAGLYNLMYKGRMIGWTEDFSCFRVEKNYRYLDEDFEKFKMKVRS